MSQRSKRSLRIPHRGRTTAKPTSGRRISHWRWVAVALAVILTRPLGAQVAGDTAPDVRLESLGGDTLRLSDFRGRPVVLNFWASWCPPCRNEMPMLADVWRARHDSGLVVIGVDGRDQEKTLNDVRRFIARYEVPFPILLDEGGKVRQRYRLLGLPTTVFIDRGGTVRFVNIGPLTRAALQQHVREIMPRP